MLIRPRLVAITAPDNMHMLLANSFIKKSCSQSLIRCNCFMTYRAYACYTRFTFWITVRAALNCHQLIRNLHRAVHLGNKLFAYKKLGLAHRAFYRLHVRCLFFAGGGQFAVRVHYKNGGEEGNYYY